MFSATVRRAMMTSTTSSAPFSRAVVRAMKKLYPTALADNSWDNTGLLLEAPFFPSRRPSNTVLLTIDLTKAVADEAIEANCSIIVAYHPIIFRGLKSIALANSQQQTLLRLASHGISVYSPHTAVDSAPGGLGDWLADIVTGSKKLPVFADEAVANKEGKTPVKEGAHDPFVEEDNKGLRPIWALAHHPSSSMQTTLRLGNQSAPLTSIPHTRKPVIPQSPELASHPGAGMGRVVHFDEPQPLPALLDRIGNGMNNPKGFPIAIPQDKEIGDITIRSVGICAGSGASLLSNLDVDLLFTGEMSHHEALAAIEKGQVVINLFHSNSERGFLSEVLLDQLDDQIEKEWKLLRDEEAGQEELKEALAEEDFEVFVSERDRDPYGIVVLNNDGQ